MFGIVTGWDSVFDTGFGAALDVMFVPNSALAFTTCLDDAFPGALGPGIGIGVEDVVFGGGPLDAGGAVAAVNSKRVVVEVVFEAVTFFLFSALGTEFFTVVGLAPV